MKATIDQLFNTTREIICYDHSDFDRPTTFTELKKCENVLVGDKVPQLKAYEVLIDDYIVWVSPRAIRHPATGDRMKVLEVM